MPSSLLLVMWQRALGPDDQGGQRSEDQTQAGPHEQLLGARWGPDGKHQGQHERDEAQQEQAPSNGEELHRAGFRRRLHGCFIDLWCARLTAGTGVALQL